MSQLTLIMIAVRLSGGQTAQPIEAPPRAKIPALPAEHSSNPNPAKGLVKRGISPRRETGQLLFV